MDPQPHQEQEPTFELGKLTGLPMTEVSLGTRYYPPGGDCDTVMFRDGKVVPLHSTTQTFFDSSEIRVVHLRPSDFDREVPESSIQYAVMSDGRAVVQQQGWRGCTAACEAMLLHDNGRPINPRSLLFRNLSPESVIIKNLEQAGLRPVVTTREPQDPKFAIEQLATLLRDHGSGILSIGGHVIMLDEISPDFQSAEVRDPFHGWAIIVTGEGLNRYLRSSSYFIQVESEAFQSA